MIYSPKRTTALQQLAKRVASEATSLADALVCDLQFARGAAPRHVEEAIRLLEAWGEDEGTAIHPDVRRGERAGPGAVAIAVHADAPLTSFARVLPAAFLAGARQCMVNLPHEAYQTAELLRRLCAGLPGVTIFTERSSAFLCRALDDAWIETIWVGGDAELLAPFGDLIQDTNTRIIFEASGNDAIVVQADADLERAAQAAVDMVFRNGGIDPASAGRVYVHADVHDAFVDRVCTLASDETLAHYTAAACRNTSIRSEAAREYIHELLDEAEDAGAELAVGLDFRSVPEQEVGPTLYPIVVADCRADLRLVTHRCRGPVMPICPYTDTADLMTALDRTSGPDGQVGAAVTVMGGPGLTSELKQRFTYLFNTAEGPFAPCAAAARLRWGGGPASWTWTAGTDGPQRSYGPIDLTYAFSQPTLISRAHWVRRTGRAQEDAAAK